MRIPARSIIALTIALVAGVGVTPVSAASWLDQPRAYLWNTPGMDVPTVPQDLAGFGLDPVCAASQGRGVENDDDQAVVDAGWSLFGAHQSGWGIDVVMATSGYDGMCRPLGYQGFVFVDSAFAGTISPDSMNSRTDGSGSVQSLADGGLTARFVRYAPDDALCCPSLGSVIVNYAVVVRPGGPIVAPQESVVEASR